MSNAFFQNSFYVGNNFNWILYGMCSVVTDPSTFLDKSIAGVELVLYAQTMYIYTTSSSTHKRSSRFFMCFSTALLILVTIFVSVQSVFGQEMWIVNANFPGGSAAYVATYASVWYQTMGTASSVVLQLMSDGLLVSTSDSNPSCNGITNRCAFVDIPMLGCLAGPQNHHSSLLPVAGDFG